MSLGVSDHYTQIRGAVPNELGGAYAPPRDIGRFGPVVFASSLRHIMQTHPNDDLMAEAVNRLWRMVEIGYSMAQFDANEAAQQAEVNDPRLTEQTNAFLVRFGKNMLTSMIPGMRQVSGIDGDAQLMLTLETITGILDGTSQCTGERGSVENEKPPNCSGQCGT